jgi:hypothetical protein
MSFYPITGRPSEFCLSLATTALASPEYPKSLLRSGKTAQHERKFYSKQRLYTKISARHQRCFAKSSLHQNSSSLCTFVHHHWAELGTFSIPPRIAPKMNVNPRSFLLSDWFTNSLTIPWVRFASHPISPPLSMFSTTWALFGIFRFSSAFIGVNLRPNRLRSGKLNKEPE